MQPPRTSSLRLRTAPHPAPFWRHWSFLALGLGAVLLLAHCTRQPTYSSRYAPTPITVDGNTAEWPNEIQYDNESHLQYQVLNDRTTLYVRVVAADPATWRQILAQGFTVWLDSTGRNRPHLGIHFPLGFSTQGDRAPRLSEESMGGAASGGSRALPPLGGLREMELLHYQGEKEPLLSDTYSRTGVRVAVDFNSQQDFTYELAVPLTILYRRPLGAEAKRVVGLTFETGKMTLPSGAPAGGGPAGGSRRGGGPPAGGMGGGMSSPGGMGGSPPGGGMGGPPGGGRPGGNMGGSMPQGIKLKKSVSLAPSP